MAVWAIADLHLSFGVPNKTMDLFGPEWKDHHLKIQASWKKYVASEDLVLIAGDISWAMYLADAAIDLEWIHHLPGTKVLVRGNHDYWWSSLNKLKKILPSSIHIIQNNAFCWNDIAVGGARLWDTPEYDFDQYIHFIEQLTNSDKEPASEEFNEKIFQRELHRLELSLKAFDPTAKHRIAITHYPPIGANLQPSQASTLLEKYHVEACVFGHLHNVKADALPFGTKNGIRYSLTSCDYLNFKLKNIFP